MQRKILRFRGGVAPLGVFLALLVVIPVVEFTAMYSLFPSPSWLVGIVATAVGEMVIAPLG